MLNSTRGKTCVFFELKITKRMYITVKEYSERYDLNLKTVYNHIRSEKIPKDRIKKVLSTTLIKV